MAEVANDNLARYETTPDEKESLASIIGNNIKDKRLDSGMSMEKMARAIGVSYQTIFRWEHGKVLAGNEHIYALSKLFKCKPSDFFKGVKGM